MSGDSDTCEINQRALFELSSFDDTPWITRTHRDGGVEESGTVEPEGSAPVSLPSVGRLRSGRRSDGMSTPAAGRDQDPRGDRRLGYVKTWCYWTMRKPRWDLRPVARFAQGLVATLAQCNGPRDQCYKHGPGPIPEPPQAWSCELASQQRAGPPDETKSAIISTRRTVLAKEISPFGSASSSHFLAKFFNSSHTPCTSPVAHPSCLSTPSPSSVGKSFPSLGLCPRAPRAGEPGPRLTRPYGPLLGPPSTPCVARLAFCSRPARLASTRKHGMRPCTLPQAVT